MAISDNDVKLLWGRAAGICSNPECRANLTVLLADAKAYNVGEMAHVIARKAGGPRGMAGGGADTYANLILLCPMCHKKVDKAPDGTYPAELLHRWKEEHEAAIRQVGLNKRFSSIDELKNFVSPLLAENHALWEQLGPESETAQSDPGSNAHVLWSLRKLDRIVPNNRKIVNAVESNIGLVGAAEQAAFFRFKTHAEAFEAHQYEPIDRYPLFPRVFTELFTV